MNTHEAVSTLVQQASRTARRWYIIGGVAMALGATVLGGVLGWLEALATGFIHVKYVLIAGTLLSAGIVAPTIRFLVRRHLGLRRPSWIRDLAQREGLSAAELESYFTLDSW
jgi:hypothetical protein